ncbi:unnamed protein product [Candida parapsilosis]
MQKNCLIQQKHRRLNVHVYNVLTTETITPAKTHAQDKLNIDEAPFLLPADDDDDEEEEEEEPDPLPPPTLVEF